MTIRKKAISSFLILISAVLLVTNKEFFFGLDSNNFGQSMKANIYILPLILLSWFLATYVLIIELKSGVTYLNLLLILPSIIYGTFFYSCYDLFMVWVVRFNPDYAIDNLLRLEIAAKYIVSLSFLLTP